MKHDACPKEKSTWEDAISRQSGHESNADQHKNRSTEIDRAAHDTPQQYPDLLKLQQGIGNQAVLQLLASDLTPTNHLHRHNHFNGLPPVRGISERIPSHESGSISQRAPGEGTKTAAKPFFSFSPEDAHKKVQELAGKIREAVDAEEIQDLDREWWKWHGFFTDQAYELYIHEGLKLLDELKVKKDLALRAPNAEFGDLLTRKKPTDVAFAQEEAKKDSDGLRKGDITPELRAEINAKFKFFRGDALDLYRSAMTEAMEAFHKKSKEFGSEGVGPRTSQSSEITPQSEPEVVDGFMVTISAQVIKETSDSAYVETYTDKSVGVELGIGGSIKKVIPVKISGSYKKGEKEGKKHEDKLSHRTTSAISRSFLVQRVKREVIKRVFTTEWAADLVKDIWGAQLNNILSKVMDYDSKGDREIGYRFTPKEGGETSEFWPIYSGSTKVPGSEVRQVNEKILEEMEHTAKLLAELGQTPSFEADF